MAEKLHRICFTEEDKVHCSFFFKIGACRHGETCTRLHIRPTSAQTLIFPHMYENPTLAIALASGDDHMIPKEKVQEVQQHFEDFYEDVFLELANYGEIEELYVMNNINAHMLGNVYLKYATDEDAENCQKSVQGRYYGGKPIYVEYSPVSDFREARCRQFDEGSCTRGGHCNFMHVKPVPRKMRERIFEEMYKEHPEYEDRHKKKHKDKDKDKDRDRDRDRDRDKDKDKDRSRDRDRDRDHKKHKSKKKHKDRSRSRSRSKNRSSSGSKDKHKEMTSEERRAMIAMWQIEDDKKEKEVKEEKEKEKEAKEQPHVDAGDEGWAQ